jgi:hypothetical protein
MIDRAPGECARHGCYKMMLSSAELQQEAHGFKRRLGFPEHGRSFLVEVPQESRA